MVRDGSEECSFTVAQQQESHFAEYLVKNICITEENGTGLWKPQALFEGSAESERISGRSLAPAMLRDYFSVWLRWSSSILGNPDGGCPRILRNLWETSENPGPSCSFTSIPTWVQFNLNWVGKPWKELILLQGLLQFTRGRKKDIICCEIMSYLWHNSIGLVNNTVIWEFCNLFEN